MKTALLCAILLLTQCGEKKKETPWMDEAGSPASVLAVHEDLLKKVNSLTLHPDSTGSAALKLQELLIHHFEEEERYLLPVLGMLPDLAKGKLPADSEGALRNIEWYKQNTQHLDVEHQFIKALLSEVVSAAAVDSHPEARELEAALRQHAAEEDEVMFPAVVVAGLYLRKVLQ